MNTPNNSVLNGLGSTRNGSTEETVAGNLSAINQPTVFANEHIPRSPPPPPRPSFLPTPQLPQETSLEERLGNLILEVNRNQNDCERRIITAFAAQNRRRSHDFRHLRNGLQQINGEIVNIKRRLESMDDESREVKRQATERHNVLRGKLDDTSRETSEKYQGMEQQLIKIRKPARKTAKKLAKLEKAFKKTVSAFRRRRVSVGKRCMGCLASNYVCVHHVGHVVNPDTVHSLLPRDKGDERGSSQKPDESGGYPSNASSPLQAESLGRPRGRRTKRNQGL